MKATCIILVLVTIAAMAFGLAATSNLGALQAQVSQLREQLTQAQEDLALSEGINQAFEKERTALQDTIGQLQGDGSAQAPQEVMPQDEDAPQEELGAVADTPAA